MIDLVILYVYKKFCMYSIWDNIWEKDVYSKEDDRTIRSQVKLDIFKSMGVDFGNYQSIGDFGGGAGYVVEEILKAPNVIKEVCLYDGSQTALQLAKEKLDYRKDIVCKFYHQDLNTPLPADHNKFDLILCFGILEHLEKMDQCLDSVYNCLKSGGDLLIVWSYRNSFFYIQRKILHLLGKWNYSYQKEVTKKFLDRFLDGKFKIVSQKIVPDICGKGILTSMDIISHKLIDATGRYMFIHLKKI